jgi:hypothetical protein
LLIAVLGSLEATVAGRSHSIHLNGGYLVLTVLVCGAVIRLHLATSAYNIFLFIVNLIVNFFSIEGVIDVLLLIALVVLIDTLKSTILH